MLKNVTDELYVLVTRWGATVGSADKQLWRTKHENEPDRDLWKTGCQSQPDVTTDANWITTDAHQKLGDEL